MWEIVIQHKTPHKDTEAVDMWDSARFTSLSRTRGFEFFLLPSRVHACAELVEAPTPAPVNANRWAGEAKHLNLRKIKGKTQVDTKPISDYFHFGLCFWYLRRVEVGYWIHNRPDIELNFVLVSIKEFFDYLDQLNLQVTRNASWKLVAFQKTIENTEKDSTLDKNQVERLHTIMSELESTLLAELKGFNTYVVSPKRLDVIKLQTNVYFLFAPNVFEKLPTLAQFDIGEAGKCIAFERSTAAAFHLMRATEAVLREYYCFHVSRNRVKPLLWGPMTKDLQNKHKFQKDEKHQILFKNLDNIRLSFRNPTQHPDKIYDIQEVQDLWGLCVDVINRMASDLPIVNEEA